MIAPTARNQFINRPVVRAAVACAAAGVVTFQWFGNATQGYVHTRSLFIWWGSQWFDPAAETQHGPLILLAAVWLFWRNLRLCSKPAPGPVAAGGPALVALLAGLALHLAGYAMQQTRISIVASLVFLWGVLALAGGRRWGRAAVFPLAFLLLAVPVSFVDSLGFFLRLTVTDWAYALAQGFGVHLQRNGTQLFSPDGHFQYDVAAACSGIRSLVALFALALLIGYLNFRSWWGRLALALAGLPYVVLGNLVRVLAIVLVGEWFGQASGERLHAGSGVLVFLAVLGLLLGTVPLLRYAGFKAVTADDEAGPVFELPSPVRPWIVAAAAGLAALAVCFAAAQLDARPAQSVAGVRLSEDGTAPAALPDFVGTEWVGRRVEVTAVEREVLPADTGYSRKEYVAIGDLRRRVFVSVVLSGRDRTSIHRPELCLVGQGWTIAGRFQHEFSAGGAPVPATVLRVEHAAVDPRAGAAPVRSLFAFWFVSGDALEPTHWGMQGRDAFDRLRHLRADRWAYVVMQTMVLDGDETAAFARMEDVLRGVWPAVRGGDPKATQK